MIIQDNHSGGSGRNCYQRQFSGPVHLSWYGVQDASNCVTDFSTCAAADTAVANAFIAAAPSAGYGGDGGVMTDGLSVVIYHGNLEIPEKQYFSCNGPPGGMRQQSTTNQNDLDLYYRLPSSIVLNVSDSAGSAVPGTVVVDQQASLHHCIVRPTWLNQSLLFDSSGNSKINSTHDLVQLIEHNLVGTCVKAGSGSPVQAESVNIHDLFIIGCDTGIDVGNAPRGILADLNIEANVPIYNHDNGGGMKLQNISMSCCRFRGHRV
ncbi:MAG TPA: hypothetical protein VLC74_03340 [Rhizomicrobium sp.]|nr:hypothetical protein [Rhizomicrobium sp.]